MIGRLDRDSTEEKKCNDHAYGKKFKSYRLGLVAGKRDGHQKDLDLKTRGKNPYIIPTEIWELLKKRSRWEMGYQVGWELGRKKKKKKKVRR